jgi:hypothetical protein
MSDKDYIEALETQVKRLRVKLQLTVQEFVDVEYACPPNKVCSSYSCDKATRHNCWEEWLCEI